MFLGVVNTCPFPKYIHSHMCLCSGLKPTLYIFLCIGYSNRPNLRGESQNRGGFLNVRLRLRIWMWLSSSRSRIWQWIRFDCRIVYPSDYCRLRLLEVLIRKRMHLEQHRQALDGLTMKSFFNFNDRTESTRRTRRWNGHKS